MRNFEPVKDKSMLDSSAISWANVGLEGWVGRLGGMVKVEGKVEVGVESAKETRVCRLNRGT